MDFLNLDHNNFDLSEEKH